MSNSLEYVFLLYGGEDEGDFFSVYETFTTDPGVAYKHWKKCEENPYSIGCVDLFTLTESRKMFKSHWKQFGYDFEREEKEEERDQLRKRLQTLNKELGE